MITCKSRAEISKMERATRIVHEVLAECIAAVQPGTTTEELDRVAAAGIKARGARAAFPGYRGYPKTLCVAINDEVVHGIPSSRKKLRSGDIVGLDLGAIVDGYFGDAARTVAVGSISRELRSLMEHTHEGLLAGIEAMRVGGFLRDIGAAIESVAKRYGYGVVREFVGHGIGTAMHERPDVPNYGPAGKGERIREGMTFAIEPMFNLGTHKVRMEADGWTVRTLDGRHSAHFEHTVVATGAGPVVLGFGRFSLDGVVTGSPAYHEYPTLASELPKAAIA